MATRRGNVVSLSRSPAAGGNVLPNDIGHAAAQAELNAELFPHYLLGRQLALEQVVRELLLAVPDAQRRAMVDTLQFNADQAMARLRDGIRDPKDESATCGYICTLLQQGF